jgi:hypothetical protein
MPDKLERILKLLFATSAVVIVDRVGTEAEKKETFTFMASEFLRFMQETVAEACAANDPELHVLQQQLHHLEELLKSKEAGR